MQYNVQPIVSIIARPLKTLSASLIQVDMDSIFMNASIYWDDIDGKLR